MGRKGFESPSIVSSETPGFRAVGVKKTHRLACNTDGRADVRASPFRFTLGLDPLVCFERIGDHDRFFGREHADQVRIVCDGHLCGEGQRGGALIVVSPVSHDLGLVVLHQHDIEGITGDYAFDLLQNAIQYGIRIEMAVHDSGGCFQGFDKLPFLLFRAIEPAQLFEEAGIGDGHGDRRGCGFGQSQLPFVKSTGLICVKGENPQELLSAVEGYAERRAVRGMLGGLPMDSRVLLDIRDQGRFPMGLHPAREPVLQVCPQEGKSELLVSPPCHQLQVIFAEPAFLQQGEGVGRLECGDEGGERTANDFRRGDGLRYLLPQLVQKLQPGFFPSQGLQQARVLHGVDGLLGQSAEEHHLLVGEVMRLAVGDKNPPRHLLRGFHGQDQ